MDTRVVYHPRSAQYLRAPRKQFPISFAPSNGEEITIGLGMVTRIKLLPLAGQKDSPLKASDLVNNIKIFYKGLEEAYQYSDKYFADEMKKNDSKINVLGLADRKRTSLLLSEAIARKGLNEYAEKYSEDLLNTLESICGEKKSNLS